MASFQITQILVIFLCIVQKSDHIQYCRTGLGSSSITCGALPVLYGSTLRKVVTIIPTSPLATLQTVSNQTAKNVEYLYINNAINNIPKDALRSFTKLKNIGFTSNEIEILHNETLENPNLESLKIIYCEVKTIESGAFSKLPNLRKIELVGNKLTVIQKNVFSNLEINFLKLSVNQIWKIEKNSFANLSNLEYLGLDYNNLTEFNVPDIVTNSPKLNKLFLDNNKFSKITNKMFKGLLNLEILDLSFNRISEIDSKTFEHTPKLKQLLLSYNFLKIFDGTVLPTKGLQELQTLSLGNNRLMYLSSNLLFRLISLKRITIGGNPWSCPCLDLVLRWLYDNSVELSACDYDFFNGKKPICFTPRRKCDPCVYTYYDKKYKLFETYYKMYLSQEGSASRC